VAREVRFPKMRAARTVVTPLLALATWRITEGEQLVFLGVFPLAEDNFACFGSSFPVGLCCNLWVVLLTLVRIIDDNHWRVWIRLPVSGLQWVLLRFIEYTIISQLPPLPFHSDAG